MNSQIMAVTVVMLCLVVPISSGFLMPAEEVTGVGYTNESPVNITSGLNNNVISTPVTYDSYLNNLFALTSSDVFPSGDSIKVQNNYPMATYVSSGSVSVNTGTIDLTSVLPANTSRYCYILDSTSLGEDVRWFRYYDLEDNPLEKVIYFPDTKIAYGYDGDRLYQVGSTIKAQSYPAGLVDQAHYYNYLLDNGSKTYLDPTTGFYSAENHWSWSNTQNNSKVSFIMSSQDSIISPLSASNVGFDLYTQVSGGRIYALTADMTEAIEIGTVSTYPQILVEFDCATSKATITGLFGMANFMDNYQSHKGNSISIPFNLTSIKQLTFHDFYGSSARYLFVPGAVLNNNVSVMNNVTVDPHTYYPQNLWLLTMTNAGVFGDSITFYITSPGSGSITGTYTYNVSDGMISDVPLGDENKDVSLNKFTVAIVPKSDGSGNTLRINGEIFNGLTLNSTDSVSIGFSGIWLMNVTVAKLVPYNYDNYQWTAGTFNIDAQTFCFIGLATSILMAVISGFCSTRYEFSGILPLIVSIGSGAVYLMMMLSY